MTGVDDATTCHHHPPMRSANLIKAAAAAGAAAAVIASVVGCGGGDSATPDQFRADANKVCRDLERTVAAGGGLRVEVTTAPVKIGNDRAVPVALILK